MFEAPPIWLPPKPAIIREVTADLLLTPAYWPADPRERVLAYRELRESGRVSQGMAREAAAVWRAHDALVFFAPIFLGGRKLPRVFNISPAVNGKTVWDLDVDGPLVLTTAGTWTITPAVGFTATVDLNGGGGGSGGGAINAPANNGGKGGDTTFAGMIAGGGAGSVGVNSSTPGQGGSDAGLASGGDLNTPGGAGTVGRINGSANVSGGNGGASPNGGAAKAGGTVTGNPGTLNGSGGNGPGGGASGSATSSTVSSSQRASGGGQGGGRCRKLFGRRVLTGASALTIGAGGAAGASNGRYTGNGATGATGRAIFS